MLHSFQKLHLLNININETIKLNYIKLINVLNLVKIKLTNILITLKLNDILYKRESAGCQYIYWNENCETHVNLKNFTK